LLTTYALPAQRATGDRVGHAHGRACPNSLSTRQACLTLAARPQPSLLPRAVASRSFGNRPEGLGEALCGFADTGSPALAAGVVSGWGLGPRSHPTTSPSAAARTARPIQWFTQDMVRLFWGLADVATRSRQLEPRMCARARHGGGIGKARPPRCRIML
jgi:hypothetical protein